MKTNSSTLTALCCGILATLGCATQLYAADANPGPTVMCSNVPPAECGEPVVTGATVQDVSGSPLTVQWVASGVLTQMVSLAAGTATNPITLYLTNTYPVGTNILDVTVNDTNAGSAQCSTEIIVRDTQPPVIHSIRAMPSVLWPPNHQWRAVRVLVDAEDCSAFTWRITQITSNEPVNGTGDGNTAPDWQIVRAHKALLRAERSGGGTGRVYTLTVEVADASGNTTNGTVTVTVPHDLGHYPAPDWALWWGHKSGWVGAWRMNGTNCGSATLLNPAAVQPGWQMAGTGDFNDDGGQQILWQHSSGWVGRWLMKGTNCVGAALLNPAAVNPGWQIVGTGDLNDDGKAEILWQHSAGWVGRWLMEGTNCIKAELFNPSSVQPGWRIVGTGDFDGDGKTEIVWQHSAGWVGCWWMDDAKCTRAALLNPSWADPRWRIVGTEDVNGDGRTDILWQHDSGLVGVWLMEGTNAVVCSLFNPGLVDPSWRIASPK